MRNLKSNHDLKSAIPGVIFLGLIIKVVLPALLLAGLADGCAGRTATQSSTSGTAGTVLRIGYPSPTGAPPSGPEGWLNRSRLLVPALKSQGISQVRFVGLPNGPDVNEALAAHAVDLGIIGDAPAIIGRAAGIQTHVVNISSVRGNCWLVAAPNGPKRVEDLRGKTVGMAKGSNMARYLIGLLAEKGLLSQVKIVHLLPGDAEPALRRGDIAAYPSPYGPLLAAHGFTIIDEAKDHPALQGTGVTIVDDTFLAAHPGFSGAWNSARETGIKDITAHEDDYYAVLAAQQRLPVSVYRRLYPAAVFVPEPFPARGVALLTETKTFLLQQNLIKTDFSIEDWLLRRSGPSRPSPNAKQSMS